MYIPGTEHVISLGGQRSPEHISRLPAMWLGPSESQVQEIDILVPTEDIPGVVFAPLLNSGEITIRVESKISGLPISHSTEIQASILDPIKDLLS